MDADDIRPGWIYPAGPLALTVLGFADGGRVVVFRPGRRRPIASPADVTRQIRTATMANFLAWIGPSIGYSQDVRIPPDAPHRDDPGMFTKTLPNSRVMAVYDECPTTSAYRSELLECGHLALGRTKPATWRKCTACLYGVDPHGPE